MTGIKIQDDEVIYMIDETGHMNVGAVIVAAGMSTRMNELKQLMKIGNMTMTERIVVNLQRVGVKDIVMVTGYQAERVENSVRRFGVTFIRNDSYETTQMFDSAKIGRSCLKDRCESVLFCPVDVPLFSDETLNRLIRAEGRLIIPVCRGRNGHPIRIDASLIPFILSYRGEGGFKGALDSLKIELNKIAARWSAKAVAQFFFHN